MRQSLSVPTLRFLLVILPFTFSACDTRTAPSSRTVVRDSAGIEIVENLQAITEIPVYGSVEESPMAELGVAGGNPDQEFGSVRSAAYLEPDRILIADGQARELLLFSLDGALLRRFGGEGEGPGEFGSFSEIHVSEADSVFVWDRRVRRITGFSLDGGAPTSVQFRGEYVDRASSVAFLDDGTVIVSGRPPNAGMRQYPEPTLIQDSTFLGRFTRSGEAIHILGDFFGSERILRLQIEGSMVRTSEANPPFPRYSRWKMAGDHLVFGDNRRFQFEWYDLNGTLERIMRTPGLEFPLGEEAVSEARESRIEAMGGAPEVRRQVDAIFSDFPLPETLPAFSEILVDSQGFLWVREYNTDWELQDTWFIFDSGGKLVGRVFLPPGAIVHEVGGDYVLLSPSHEQDVPMIRLHRLARGSGS